LGCGLTQREAGEVFGTGAKSFEKYESGSIKPSAPTRRLLRLAMEQPALFQPVHKGATPLSGSDEAALVHETLRLAHLDHLYAPLFQGIEAGGMRPSVR
jgi:HTH-type transcriptional regulator/antitoxin MqsA